MAICVNKMTPSWRPRCFFTTKSCEKNIISSAEKSAKFDP